jgi:hypothetical protein
VNTCQGGLRDQPECPQESELPFEEFGAARRRWRTTRVERGSIVKEGEWA